MADVFGLNVEATRALTAVLERQSREAPPARDVGHRRVGDYAPPTSRRLYADPDDDYDFDAEEERSRQSALRRELAAAATAASI